VIGPNSAKRTFIGVAVATLLIAGCDAGSFTSGRETSATTSAVPGDCPTSQVRYGPYPGSDPSLSSLPWVAGEPDDDGLIGLLWYWPGKWQKGKVRKAMIFLNGEALAGTTTKILWAFTAPSARDLGGSELLVEGHRLDGPGTLSQTFAAISYANQDGAPSYASIIDVPKPGCWELKLSTADLRATVVFRAVRAK
jgi:hypothetical protein